MIRSAFALLLLGAAAPAAGQPIEPRDFKRQFAAAGGSWERRALILRLDPADRAARKLLVKGVLETQEWFLREAAIERIAATRDPRALDALKGERDPLAREGVALALGRQGDPGHVPFLLGLLRDKRAVVRRGAAIALRAFRDRLVVDGLIAAWEGEPAFEVWIHLLESLEALTGERDLRSAQAWRDWWDTVGAEWVAPDPDPAADGSGERIRAAAGGTRLDLRSRGRGSPLLVLPEYGYERGYLETWLRDLEDASQVLYLDLPGAADFEDPPLEPAPGLPDPYYPIDRLVAAFEALHGQLVAERKIQDVPFAVVAHGLSGWIAMRYAALHPGRVRRLILVAPYSGGAAWEAGRERVERRGGEVGDPEMVHFAQSQLYGGYEAQSEDEEEALQRKEWTLYFADPRGLEIGRLYGPVVSKGEGEEAYEMRQLLRPLGTVAIPEFELSALDRQRVPTLVCHGERAVRTSLEDAQAVAAHFGGKVVRFKRSARAPFVEDHDAFVAAVRDFLD